MTATPEIDAGRKRSVDSLQRLYTVVVSLSLAETLRGLLSGLVSNQPSDYERWLMFVAFVFTVVPFYHGANRYLDATYVTHERSAKPGALMVDFVMLFVEGLGIFALAILAQKGPQVFYTALAGLLVFDAIWVGITVLMAAGESDKFPDYRQWAEVNLLAALTLLLFAWSDVLHLIRFRTVVATSIALMLVPVARTFYDYIKVWPFYYPKGLDIIPAPAPAPPPKPPATKGADAK